jgi:hypothetical protein
VQANVLYFIRKKGGKPGIRQQPGPHQHQVVKRRQSSKPADVGTPNVKGDLTGFRNTGAWLHESMGSCAAHLLFVSALGSFLAGFGSADTKLTNMFVLVGLEDNDSRSRNQTKLGYQLYTGNHTEMTRHWML